MKTAQRAQAQNPKSRDEKRKADNGETTLAARTYCKNRAIITNYKYKDTSFDVFSVFLPFFPYYFEKQGKYYK
jgi:hypothetical protein